MGNKLSVITLWCRKEPKEEAAEGGWRKKEEVVVELVHGCWQYAEESVKPVNAVS